MNRMRRATGFLALIALLAACAAPGTGGGPTEPAGTAAPASAHASAVPDASDGASSGTVTRVDIGTLAGDPSAFKGTYIKVLARVDRVLVDGAAFVTSPSATEEDQIPVIVMPDAQVEKDLAEGSVVWVEGTVIGLTEQELSDAGIDLPLDQLGFDGEWVIVADRIADPLAGDGSS